MDKWTAKMVEERLVDAAAVMRRLPPVRVPGRFNTWPHMIVEFADRVGQEPKPLRLPPPSRRYHPDGGNIDVAAVARTRGRQAGMGARRSHAMEGDLLAIRCGARDGESALAVRTQRDRLAAEWSKASDEAVAHRFVVKVLGGELIKIRSMSSDRETT